MDIKQYHKLKEIEYKLLSTIPKEIFFRKDEEYQRYLSEKLDFVSKFCNNFFDISKLPKIIHIAGSGGKGTVAHLLAHALENKGFQVGLFTSPHINCFLERILLSHKIISPSVFINIAENVLQKYNENIKSIQHIPFSYFELMLVIALIYFIDKKADYIILETGLGGKYDATNIFKEPYITVLTSIHKEHTNILGNSTIEIAQNKAEIIKPNVPVFLMYPQVDEGIIDIFKNKTTDILFHYGMTLKHDIRDKNMLKYGWENYNLTWAILQYIDIYQNVNDFIDSLSKIYIQGRIECIDNKPDIILDVAHNPTKIKFLIDKLDKLYVNNKYHFLIAIIEGKDWKSIINNILPYAKSITLTKVMDSFRNAIDINIVLEYINDELDYKNVSIENDPIIAFYNIKNKIEIDEILVVTGSFLLVGKIRELYYPEYYILQGDS